MLIAPVQDVAKKVKALATFVEEVKEVVIGRSVVISQIIYALLTKEHVLLEGPPGVAKSMLAREVFRGVKGANVFSIQCTKKMTEDSLVGPPNVKILRDEGKFVHNVEGTIVEADFAFVDEFLDLSSGAMRALLEVLNERTFSRGHQYVKCRLNTCIATTNFNKSDDEEAAAVLDRFLFKAKLSLLDSKNDILAMLSAKAKVSGGISFSDLQALQKRVESVTVPKYMMEVYVSLCTELGTLTDRTIKKGLAVLKASAVLNERSQVDPSDLSALQYCFCVVGDKSSELKFAAQMPSLLAKAKAEQIKALSSTVVVKRVASLSKEASKATDYSHIRDSAIDAVAYLKLESEGAISLAGESKAELRLIVSKADKMFDSAVPAEPSEDEGESR